MFDDTACRMLGSVRNMKQMYPNTDALGRTAQAVCSSIFLTKPVHRQPDLVRGMVNGDAVYPRQRAAGPEEQFVAELQLGVDAVVPPLITPAVEVGLADCIAGFVHYCSDHFASDVLRRRRDGSQSIQPCAGPGVPTQMYPSNDTPLGERIKLYHGLAYDLRARGCSLSMARMR